MIIFTHPDKPMQRAAKGTVLRKPALNAYEKEIAELYVIFYNIDLEYISINDHRYETVEASTKESDKVEPPKSWLRGDIEQWLIKHAADIMSSQSFDPQADLFEHGFDR